MLIMKKRCPHLRTKSLTRLHRTSDEKHSRKLPTILTSLNVYEDDIIKKNSLKKFPVGSVYTEQVMKNIVGTVQSS